MTNCVERVSIETIVDSLYNLKDQQTRIALEKEFMKIFRRSSVSTHTLALVLDPNFVFWRGIYIKDNWTLAGFRRKLETYNVPIEQKTGSRGFQVLAKLCPQENLALNLMKRQDQSLNIFGPSIWRILNDFYLESLHYDAEGEYSIAPRKRDYYRRKDGKVNKNGDDLEIEIEMDREWPMAEGFCKRMGKIVSLSSGKKAIEFDKSITVSEMMHFPVEDINLWENIARKGDSLHFYSSKEILSLPIETIKEYAPRWMVENYDFEMDPEEKELLEKDPLTDYYQILACFMTGYQLNSRIDGKIMARMSYFPNQLLQSLKKSFGAMKEIKDAGFRRSLISLQFLIPHIHVEHLRDLLEKEYAGNDMVPFYPSIKVRFNSVISGPNFDESTDMPRMFTGKGLIASISHLRKKQNTDIENWESNRREIVDFLSKEFKIQIAETWYRDF